MCARSARVCRSTRKKGTAVGKINYSTKTVVVGEREMQVNPFQLGKQVKDKEQRKKKLTTSPDKRKAFVVNRKRGCVAEVAISVTELFRRTQTDAGLSAGFPDVTCDP